MRGRVHGFSRIWSFYDPSTFALCIASDMADIPSWGLLQIPRHEDFTIPM